MGYSSKERSLQAERTEKTLLEDKPSAEPKMEGSAETPSHGLVELEDEDLDKISGGLSITPVISSSLVLR